MEYKDIIIIDDEEDMIELLKLELESEGFRVRVASEGKIGLELVRVKHPHLVLLDVMMPNMDGYQVLKSLKEDKSTQKIPVLMLTAKGLDTDIQKGLDLGADDYITKPFHSNLLIKRIKMILQNLSQS
jgi:DNA-binding response OmpR family regulator